MPRRRRRRSASETPPPPTLPRAIGDPALPAEQQRHSLRPPKCERHDHPCTQAGEALRTGRENRVSRREGGPKLCSLQAHARGTQAAREAPRAGDPAPHSQGADLVREAGRGLQAPDRTALSANARRRVGDEALSEGVAPRAGTLSCGSRLAPPLRPRPDRRRRARGPRRASHARRTGASPEHVALGVSR